MLVQEKKKEEIAAHLSLIEKERMGLSVTSRTRAHATNVAQILIENYEWPRKRGQAPRAILNAEAKNIYGGKKPDPFQATEGLNECASVGNWGSCALPQNA